jgi:hypothetical protein
MSIGIIEKIGGRQTAAKMHGAEARVDAKGASGSLNLTQ